MRLSDTAGPPLRLHGSAVSYFTGKLEAYLRYKEIPHVRVPMTARQMRGVVRRRTGAAQMPALELPDGRWLTDTTPTIAWLETRRPEPAVIPADPLQAFACRLLEDYADEWLWRPALHYRWSFAPDARLLSGVLAREMLGERSVPHVLARQLILRRQRRVYVRRDGVTPATRAHVEGIYLATLDRLEAVLAARPYLLGTRPCLADFGFFASMFRHFALDPTPGAVMRARAPAVFAWVARLWNARTSRTSGAFLEGVPDDWDPILDDVGAAYLPYLGANAWAWTRGARRFDVTVQGARYRALPTSRYRVWCLEQLRARYEELPDAARGDVRARLERHGCGEPLWRTGLRPSGHDPEGRAPFGAGLRVFA